MKYSRFKQHTAVLLALFATACNLNETGDSDASMTSLLAVDAAAGSMAPNLIAGPDGTIVLSWIEPANDGHALRHSTLQSGNWSAPRTVVSGAHWFKNWADFPSVVPLSESLWAAHWLVSQESGGYAYDVRVTLSRDRGDTWTASTIPHSDGTDTEHGFVTLYADGDDLGMVWLDGRKMVNDYDEQDKRASGMTLRAAGLDAQMTLHNEALVDDLTCDCCQTDVAVTDEGPVVIYRDRTENEIRDIYVSRRVDGQWQPGIAVAEDQWEIDACPVNGPVIQAHGSKVAVAWFTASDDLPQIKVAWSEDSGKTFSKPIVVAADRPRGHVGAAILGDGSLAVSWLRSSGNGGAELVMNRITQTGAVSNPYVLEEAQDIFAFSVPQLSRDGDSLIAAWTTSIDDVYGIASARIPTNRLAIKP